MDSAVIAAIIGPALTALLGLLAYIAVKVHKHELTDQGLKRDVQELRTNVDRIEDKVDQLLDKAA